MRTRGPGPIATPPADTAPAAAVTGAKQQPPVNQDVSGWDYDRAADPRSQCSNGLPNGRALPPVAVVRPCRNKYIPTATNAKVAYPLACVSAALVLMTPSRDSSRARSTSRNSSVNVPGRRRVKRVSNTITTSQEIRNISWVPFTAAASAGLAGLIPYQS